MDGVDPNLPTLDRWIQGGGQAPSLFVGKIWLITRGRGVTKLDLNVLLIFICPMSKVPLSLLINFLVSKLHAYNAYLIFLQTVFWLNSVLV